MDQELEKERNRKTKCIVLDVPIPVRKGFVDHCNQIWTVVCDESVRIPRLVKRGMDKDDAMRRIAMQMTDDEYAALGDHVIDNSGTMDELKEKRVSKQPLEYPSAGSTFKRPEGYFAAKLIDDAGLRGYRVGGAMVSEKHCGFVVNYENATSTDVIRLMDDVKAKVWDFAQVKLEPEVRIIGRF